MERSGCQDSAGRKAGAVAGISVEVILDPILGERGHRDLLDPGTRGRASRVLLEHGSRFYHFVSTLQRLEGWRVGGLMRSFFYLLAVQVS